MSSSQQNVYRFERASDSIMTRTMDGIINFWNRSAETLYGWAREEAIGKVSHDLLQTQFPQPLEEIESELVRNGRWEGKLVHATRKGGRVVVNSCWIFDPTEEAGAVVEINVPFGDDQTDPAERTDAQSGGQEPLTTRKLERARENARSAGRIRRVLSGVVPATLLCLAIIWVFYALFGRLLIHAIYTSNSIGIADQLMAGRASTPVENYYWHADRLLWSGTIQILAICAVGWLAIRNLGGAILAGFSLFLSSFVLFSALEMFPSLIKTFHLDLISPYLAYKANYIYDEELLFRERPFNNSVTVGFKGSHYSPIFGIDVPPITIDWRTDEDGFRNSRKTDFADIVVVGDSYMDYGANESDTFPKILQEQLPGLTVMNLGKGGYGPFQYLEVLKRFGLKYKPRYVLFAFYEGNDILDIQGYRSWKAGNLEGLGDLSYIAAPKSFFGHYWLALKTIANQLSEDALVRVQMALNANPLLGEERHKIHPDLALLNLGDGKRHKMYIADRTTRLHDAMLERENWVALERIFRDFRDFCETHQITPIVLYAPSPSHIYAKFSTDKSGGNWLAIREKEIATEKDIENTVAGLVRSAGLDFISLSPVLERGARDGKLLYFLLDSHWNLEGTEVVAEYVADYLRASYSLPSN